MSVPYFCLHKLAWTSATNMAGSPCYTNGCKLILGANAKSNPWPLGIVLVRTLLLPAIQVWGLTKSLLRIPLQRLVSSVPPHCLSTWLKQFFTNCPICYHHNPKWFLDPPDFFHSQKLLGLTKRDSPLSPGMRESVRLSPNNLKKGLYDFIAAAILSADWMLDDSPLILDNRRWSTLPVMSTVAIWKRRYHLWWCILVNPANSDIWRTFKVCYGPQKMRIARNDNIFTLIHKLLAKPSRTFPPYGIRWLL